MASPTVLFVCIRNAGRSQIAEAIFTDKAAGRATARSAGSDPAEAVHPEVSESLARIGLDPLGSPKGLTPEILDGVDVIVGMGCGDACPTVPGGKVIEWDIPDPAGRTAEEVDAIRDDIARRVENLLGELALR